MQDATRATPSVAQLGWPRLRSPGLRFALYAGWIVGQSHIHQIHVAALVLDPNACCLAELPERIDE
jgi:hypothetical protein